MFHIFWIFELLDSCIFLLSKDFQSLDRAKMSVRTFILPIMRLRTFIMGKMKERNFIMGKILHLTWQTFVWK